MTTADINNLITTALKDVIKQAVAHQIDARIEALDVDVASALVYFNRKNKDLETANEQLRARVTQLENAVYAPVDAFVKNAVEDIEQDLETANEQLRARVTQLENRADVHDERRKAVDTRVNTLEEAGAYIIENLQKTSDITLACQDEIKELHKANADREQELEDNIADLVEDVVNDKFGNYDITDKVRYVLEDARINI
jgi:hypothetical protein